MSTFKYLPHNYRVRLIGNLACDPGRQSGSRDRLNNNKLSGMDSFRGWTHFLTSSLAICARTEHSGRFRIRPFGSMRANHIFSKIVPKNYRKSCNSEDPAGYLFKRLPFLQASTPGIRLPLNKTLAKMVR